MKKQQNRRFTVEERRAYYMGVGAAIGFGKISAIKRAANKMRPAEKKSFYNGFDDGFMKKNK